MVRETLELIPYYFEYDTPLNLRLIQFWNVYLRGKITNLHIPRI
jgi:hypothetical protein